MRIRRRCSGNMHAVFVIGLGSIQPRTFLFFPRRVVPLALYGDGAKVTRDEHTVAITWNSCLVKGAAIDCKHLLIALPQPYLRPESLDEVSRIIKWSFGCMWDGLWPTTDRLARPWPRHDVRSWSAGSHLAGGPALGFWNPMH